MTGFMIQVLRESFDEAFLDARPDPAVAFEATAAAGDARAWWSTPPVVDDAFVVLFLHGGSYSAYAADDPWYRAFATRLAALAGCRVLSLGYRLAPAHPFPAALDDARAGLAAAATHGRVFLVGDSAGAGLAMALALDRDARVAGVVSVSGLFDLTASGASYVSRRWTGAGGDPIFNGAPDDERRSTIADGLVYLGRVDADGDALEDDVEDVLRAVLRPRSRWWPLACLRRHEKVGDARLVDDLRSDRVSPLFARTLRGLPPLLLLVGGDEVLLDDTLKLARRAVSDAVDVDVKVFDGMWHDFVFYLEGNALGHDAPKTGVVLDEALVALRLIAAFLRRGREPLDPAPALALGDAVVATTK